MTEETDYSALHNDSSMTLETNAETELDKTSLANDVTSTSLLVNASTDINDTNDKICDGDDDNTLTMLPNLPTEHEIAQRYCIQTLNK